MRRILSIAILGVALSSFGCKTAEVQNGPESEVKDITVEGKDSELEHFQFKIRDNQVTYSKCERASIGANPRCRIEKRMAWSSFRTKWISAFLKGDVRETTAGEKRSQAAVEKRLRSTEFTEYENDLDDASERMRPWIAAIPVALGVDAKIGDEPSQDSNCASILRLSCIEGNADIGCQARSRDRGTLFGTVEPSAGWCSARVRMMKKICRAGKEPKDFSVYCYAKNNPPPQTPDRASISECNLMWPRCFVAGADATCDAKPRSNRNITAVVEDTKGACAPSLYAKDTLCRHGVDPSDFRINCVDNNPNDCRLNVRSLSCEPGMEPNTDGCAAGKARGCTPVANVPSAEEAIVRSYTKTPINGGINPAFSGLKITASVMIGSNACQAEGREASLKVEKFTAADGGPTTRVITAVVKQVVPVPANRRCPRNFAPVYKDASDEVRFNRMTDSVTLKHYKEFGKVESIVSRQN